MHDYCLGMGSTGTDPSAALCTQGAKVANQCFDFGIDVDWKLDEDYIFTCSKPTTSECRRVSIHNYLKTDSLMSATKL